MKRKKSHKMSDKGIAPSHLNFCICPHPQDYLTRGHSSFIQWSDVFFFFFFFYYSQFREKFVHNTPLETKSIYMERKCES